MLSASILFHHSAAEEQSKESGQISRLQQRPNFVMNTGFCGKQEKRADFGRSSNISNLTEEAVEFKQQSNYNHVRKSKITSRLPCAGFIAPPLQH